MDFIWKAGMLVAGFYYGLLLIGGLFRLVVRGTRTLLWGLFGNGEEADQWARRQYQSQPQRQQEKSE